jgi:cell division transport system permease protein
MKKRKAGSPAQGNFSRSVKVWLAQHAQSLVSSIGQLHKNLASNLFSIAVIGISLALPSGFYLILANAERVMENWDGAIQIALYLHPDISANQSEDLREELLQLEIVDEIILITKEQALDEYRNFSGFAEALDALDENPLPTVLLVQPRVDALSSDEGAALLEQLGKRPEVESAQFDRQWVNRLFIILTILERAVIILAIMLSLAVLLIIGNTIRLSILNKRTEIEINKLFGATNAFIQRPFLYTGLIFGITGSVIAWLLLLISTAILQGPVHQLALLYNSDFSLQGLSIGEFCILMGTGGGLGLLGSWVAVDRHIRATEPT